MSFDSNYDTQQLIKWLTSGLQSGKLKHTPVFDERGGIKALLIHLRDETEEERMSRLYVKPMQKELEGD